MRPRLLKQLLNGPPDQPPPLPLVFTYSFDWLICFTYMTLTCAPDSFDYRSVLDQTDCLKASTPLSVLPRTGSTVYKPACI